MPSIDAAILRHANEGHTIMLITGSDSRERITGTNSADRILAGGADDTVIGNGGNDTIFGQTGNDALYGGSGNDLLYGGAGSDFLVGGSGADAFVFATRPAGDGLTEMDAIFDFAREDMIAIDNGLYPALGTATGYLAAWAFKVVGTGGIVDGNDRIIYNQLTGVLSYDWNGSATGGRVALADLTGNPVLTAGDIYIF
jgi:Ca2+-binding RTX toxin-like protein